MVFHIQSSMCNGELSEGFAATLQQAKMHMLQIGELTEEMAQYMVLPEFCKSPSEILDPLCSGPNSTRWKVEDLRYMKLPCPYMEEFKARGHEPSIAEEIVEKQIGFLRAFMDPSLEKYVGEDTTEAFWAHVRMFADGSPPSLSSDWMGTFFVLHRL